MSYYSYNTYLRERFGCKVRRISLNAGFPCPNKDGTISGDGCVFCNEEGFSRFAATDISLKEQIERSIRLSRDTGGVSKFIAYFQNAAGTNAETAELEGAYAVIRDYPEIVGLCIATRPDCIDDKKLDLIAGYTGDHDVWIEYGVQTVHDRTLMAMNRGHTFARSAEAIKRTADRGIKAGAHIILGLPGETGADMVSTAREMSRLPVSGVKLHVLHVLKGTVLDEMYRRGEIELMTRERYVRTACDFLENLRPDCVILRLVSDAKKEFLTAPGWITDKLAVIDQIEKEFSERGTAQGSAWRSGVDGEW
ncbi:MAG: TIGR01212 family radical SAM protein [Candidatus Omnitrophota bacterium]